jgi:hypothetical protein
MAGDERFERYLGRILGAGLAALAVLLLLPSAAGAADRRSGAKVLVIMAQTGEQIEGELIGVRDDAIVVDDRQGGSHEIPIGQISTVRVKRRSKALVGTLFGILGGGAAGAALSSSRDTSGDGMFEGVLWTLIYVGGGAVVGGVLGGVSGGLMGANEKYELRKMTAAGKSDFVAKMRKKARVKDYQ